MCWQKLQALKDNVGAQTTARFDVFFFHKTVCLCFLEHLHRARDTSTTFGPPLLSGLGASRAFLAE